MQTEHRAKKKPQRVENVFYDTWKQDFKKHLGRHKISLLKMRRYGAVCNYFLCSNMKYSAEAKKITVLYFRWDCKTETTKWQRCSTLKYRADAFYTTPALLRMKGAYLWVTLHNCIECWSSFPSVSNLTPFFAFSKLLSGKVS